MEPGALILIIAFIVAPLIERLLKAGKQGQDQPPPQPRAPQPRAPEQRIPAERFPRDGRGSSEDADPPVVVSRRTESDEAAAGMLPDDLWEILTGERRTPRETLPQPRPVPQPSYEEEDYSLEEPYSLEDGGSLENQSPGEWITTSPEDDAVMMPEKVYTRPNPIRAVPKVVSLEQLEYDSEIRHDEFHDRLDSLGGAAKVRRPALSAYRFRTDEDLRRAIVMAEILGPPKGLEDIQ